MNNLKQDFLNYWQAGFPGLYVVSSEELRVEQMLLWAVEQRTEKLKKTGNSDSAPRFFSWTISGGWVDALDEDLKPIKLKDIGDTKNPPDALSAAFRFPENSIAVMKDFHPWMDDPALLRQIKDLASVYKRSTCRLLVFVSPRLPYAGGAREGYGLPAEIARELTLIHVPLPTRDELGQVLDGIVSVPGNGITTPTPEQQEVVLQAAAGMTTQEAENAFALAGLEYGTFSHDGAIKSVYHCKTQAVKRGGALECIMDSGEDLDDVGGFSLYKQFVQRKAEALSAKASAFGLRKPKGVLLLGAPGTGKSLCAKATATYLKLPLLRLDVGALYGSYVGDSERNTREALQTAEAMSPVVLWLDEIDKSMGSATAAGLTSDVTQRVIGTILTWRQETTTPVFMVATANRLDKLDPALMRAGRFDAVFWVDLPTRSEREDIFKIHLRKKGRDTLSWIGNPDKSANLSDLADLSEGYSGAEIAEAVEEGLLEAFHAGRELMKQDITLALKRIVPLSQTAEQELKTMREWLQGRARPVSEEKLIVAEPGKRRRSIER